MKVIATQDNPCKTRRLGSKIGWKIPSEVSKIRRDVILKSPFGIPPEILLSPTSIDCKFSNLLNSSGISLCRSFLAKYRYVSVVALHKDAGIIPVIRLLYIIKILNLDKLPNELILPTRLLS